MPPLLISIGTDPSDPQDTEEALHALRRELDDIDVPAAPLPAGPAPLHTRGADVAALTALAVAVWHPEVLAPLIELVRSWAGRQGRTVRIEIDGDVLELSRADADQQRRIVDEWLRRHGGEAR
ncbi:hypothetical protein [Catenuloplanes atrovinosus]|uniref:Uncharacterized protein n=1 Tax=Catenuloplanes atrovinosus TaxID=137266 RepID=A0AAE3YLF2_9ACTN|nr:hypothetical protein [Catenuloplanes atrovinosus]MDR7275993.1 hypothetical protein [Catenuloplanes atrovinosus]